MYSSSGVQAADDSPVRVRALTYHRFGEERFDPFCVNPADFESQVRYLSEEGRLLSPDSLRSFLSGESTVRQDSCLITIDDGMCSTMDVAYPVLEKYSATALIFVSSGLVGRTLSGSPESYMGWADIRGLSRSGVIEVGSHAHTHRSFGKMTERQVLEEARRSRMLLEQEIGKRVSVFAYPFGTYGDFTSVTDDLLIRAGYELAFNSMHGAITADAKTGSMPRIKVEGGEPLGCFAQITRGGLDAWRLVDRNFWRLQRVRQELS